MVLEVNTWNGEQVSPRSQAAALPRGWWRSSGASWCRLLLSQAEKISCMIFNCFETTESILCPITKNLA